MSGLRRVLAFLAAAAVALVGGCSAGPATIDDTAEAYVKLALKLGKHDDGFYGYYYGPEEWLGAAEVAGTPLGEIREEAAARLETLRGIEPPEDPMERRRLRSLAQLLTAMVARVEILEGRNPASFNEETRRLYDVVLPLRDQQYFRGLFDKLNEVLPGEGPLVERAALLRERPVEVPAERLQAVFDAALAECRRRTLEHVELPEGEGVVFEFVSGVPYAARSVYVGNGQSLMQVNTDVPMNFDAVVQIACHEGYPGHHVQNVLLDSNLVRTRDWVEYTLEPLYGAGRLISEGAAQYGVRLAFPGDELRRFKAEVLMPAAGVDPAEAGEAPALPAEAREQALDLLLQLQGVREEVARQYLDGNFNRDQALQWLAVFGLLGSPEAAAPYLETIETFRSAVIQQGYAEQYVRWLLARNGANDDETRWRALAGLFTRPPVLAEAQ